jgi:hypothetical protein
MPFQIGERGFEGRELLFETLSEFQHEASRLPEDFSDSRHLFGRLRQV